MIDTCKRGRGRPKVDARFDDWNDVEDRKERKRIQDRLAQRARRDRILAQKRGAACYSSEFPRIFTCFAPNDEVVIKSYAKSEYSENDRDTSILDNSDVIALPTRAQPTTFEAATNHSNGFVCYISQDHTVLTWPAWPIFSALKQHGIMQGIMSGRCHEEGTSDIASRCLPEALRPTPLQLVVPHRRSIDRFPFPRLRDNMILLKNYFSIDDFCRDLFDMAGLVIRAESWKGSWDPTSWEMGSEFSEKWGYLFN